MYFLQTVEKTKIKQNRLGMAHFKKQLTQVFFKVYMGSLMRFVFKALYLSNSNVCPSLAHSSLPHYQEIGVRLLMSLDRHTLPEISC